MRHISRRVIVIDPSQWHSDFWLCVFSANPVPDSCGAQKSLDSGTKNLLASLCLSSRKARARNEEKLHDRTECSTRQSEVTAAKILRLGSVKGVSQFADHLRALQLRIPCDSEILRAAESPLFLPLTRGEIKIGNRIAVNPMEGRYCKPNSQHRAEPRILYRHPILDRRLGLARDFPVLTDGEIGGIIEDFHRAARIAWELGFDFVDIKHCHGYLGHEFLSAHTREGKYGGSFENRTRFLREIVQGIRAAAPQLKIGVRVSAFDTVPFHPDPAQSANGKLGPGIPEPHADLLPYRWGFGVNASDPTQPDLAEPIQFLSLLESLNIFLVNLTAGSPYYNPHIQRPALYPPSDGYLPPEDPLVGVARQMDAARELKRRFPNLLFVGTAYSYLQDFLQQVAQAALREGWVDSVGLGRMVLTYPEIFLDAAQGRAVQHKRICRTFSDCTTAPRNGLPSGCYPLDSHYKTSSAAVQLTALKAKR